MTTNNILVTGFGPFGEHKINASWEAVSGLPNEIDGVNIIKLQIPVSYAHVDENIPLLWQQYNPKLVIHVGVSSCTTEIQLESRAYKTGYKSVDIQDTCPANGLAICGKDDSETCIKTGLCTEIIRERINKHPQLKAAVSDDAGRYLCEYIYYTSLNQDNKRVLFVHVPPLNQPFSKKQLTSALEEIIKCALELISEEERTCTCFPKDSAKIYKNGRAAAF